MFGKNKITASGKNGRRKKIYGRGKLFKLLGFQDRVSSCQPGADQRHTLAHSGKYTAECFVYTNKGKQIVVGINMVWKIIIKTPT